MTQATPAPDSKGYADFEQLQKRLIAAARNPRDKAFIALLARDGIRVSEAIQLKGEWYQKGGYAMTKGSHS